MSGEKKPICIVMDTNIWYQDSNLLLNTPKGSELLYILRKSGGKIGLPEIIEEEVIRKMLVRGTKAAEEINRNFKTVEKIIGFRWLYKVPNEVELEDAIRKRLIELNDLFHKIECTSEHKKSAQKRVDEKSPPNSRKPQFNDSAIWEAILDLLDSYTVHFICGDKQFYKGEDVTTKALAKNLLEDCRKRCGNVHIYNDMESCFPILWKDVPKIDYSNLILKIDGVINPRLRIELLAETGFEVVNLISEDSSVSAFFIEIKDNLLLNFELCYQCIDIRNNDNEKRKNARLNIKGACLYEFNSQVISDSDSDIKKEFERISWIEPSGEPNRRGAVYPNCIISIGGSQKVPFSFKEPVDSIRFFQ